MGGSLSQLSWLATPERELSEEWRAEVPVKLARMNAVLDVDHIHSNFECDCFSPAFTGCTQICKCFGCRIQTDWSPVTIPYFCYENLQLTHHYETPSIMVGKAKEVREALKKKYYHSQCVLQGLTLDTTLQRAAVQLLDLHLPVSLRGRGVGHTLYWDIYERLVQESRFCKRMKETYKTLQKKLEELPEDCTNQQMSTELNPYFSQIEMQTEWDRECFCYQHPSDLPNRVWMLQLHDQETNYDWTPWQFEPWNSAWEEPRKIQDFILKRAFHAGRRIPLNFHLYQGSNSTDFDLNPDLAPN